MRKPLLTLLAAASISGCAHSMEDQHELIDANIAWSKERISNGITSGDAARVHDGRMLLLETDAALVQTRDEYIIYQKVLGADEKAVAAHIDSTHAENLRLLAHVDSLYYSGRQ